MHGQCTALHAAAPPQRNPQGCFDGDSWAGVGQLPSVLTAHPSAQGKVREEGTAAILTSAVVPRQLLKAVLIGTKGGGWGGGEGRRRCAFFSPSNSVSIDNGWNHFSPT